MVSLFFFGWSYNETYKLISRVCVYMKRMSKKIQNAIKRLFGLCQKNKHGHPFYKYVKTIRFLQKNKYFLGKKCFIVYNTLEYMRLSSINELVAQIVIVFY